MKDYKGAIEDATLGIQANPKYIKNYFRRATALKYQKKKVEACWDLKRILEIEENNVTVRKDLEKVISTLSKEDKKRVEEFNEGFKRVEIEEGEDSSDSESEEEVQSKDKTEIKKPVEVETPKQKELPKGIKKRIDKFSAKKEKMSEKLKSGLFEDVMKELSQCILEIEEFREDDLQTPGFIIGQSIQNKRKMAGYSVKKADLNDFMTQDKPLMALTATVPGLKESLELEMALKSNLCHCYKQTSQTKNLVFVANNLLSLASHLMLSDQSMVLQGGKILDKTLKRRALALEEMEMFEGAYRDFWLCRAFNSFDKIVVTGLQRNRGYLTKAESDVTKQIEQDFSDYTKKFRVREEQTKVVEEVVETVVDTPTPVVVEEVVETVVDTPTPVVVVEDEEIKTTTLVMDDTDEEEQNNYVEFDNSSNENKEDTKETSVDLKESSMRVMKFNETELESFEATKAAGNACFKKQDITTAIKHYSTVIKQMIKGEPSEYLKGYQQLSGSETSHLNISSDQLKQKAQREIKFTEKTSVDLFLSLLGNRGISYSKQKNFGKSFEDASLALLISETHTDRMGEFKVPNAKLHYRRMLSLEGLIDAADKQIKTCRNEILVTSMLESLSVYLIELIESCQVVIACDGTVTKTATIARQLIKRFEWMETKLTELKEKQNKGKECSEETRKSMQNIPSVEKDEESTQNDVIDFGSSTSLNANSPTKEKSILNLETVDTIAQKAMRTLLDNPNPAVNASEFERQIDSFKKNYKFVFEYLQKINKSKLESFYEKRKLEVNTVSKVLSCFNYMIGKEEVTDRFTEFKRVLEVLMNLPKCGLAFKMLMKKEKKQLREVLAKTKEAEGLERFEEYCQNFKL